MALELDQETLDQLGYRQKTVDPSERLHGEMHLIAARSKKRRYIPAFALDDRQLQAVLIHAAIKFVYRDKPLPPVLDIPYILTNDDGRTAKLAAIAYRAWRLEWTAPTIAREQGISKSMVWDAMQVLAAYAKELGLPTYDASPTKGIVRIDQDVIAAMWMQGRSIAEIVAASGHCRYRIGLVLKRLGLKQHKRIRQTKADASVKMWNEGHAVNEIRRTLGCGYRIIVKVLTARGLYVPRSKAYGAKKWAAQVRNTTR
jgi:hypothetical protein